MEETTNGSALESFSTQYFIKPYVLALLLILKSIYYISDSCEECRRHELRTEEMA